MLTSCPSAAADRRLYHHLHFETYSVCSEHRVAGFDNFDSTAGSEIAYSVIACSD